MERFGFILPCLLLLHAATAFDERLFKHFTEPKPGGILDIIKKPRIPGVNFQLGSQGSFGIGSFGFGFNFGGQYKPPPGGGVINLPPPPKESHVPDVDSHEVKPEVLDLTPHLPGVTWEKEKGKPRPNWEEYGEDDLKHGSYEQSKKDRPKLNPYEESKEDKLPDWEDIGEGKENEDFESKSEKFNNGDLTGGGLIEPRRNRYRGKRFIESHVYHVPLLFRSNAKPYQVKVQSNPNSLLKDGLAK